MSNWTPAKERPPVGDMEVLAITRTGQQFVGSYGGKDWRGRDRWYLTTVRSRMVMPTKVVGWMRLPPGQEEGEHDVC